VLLFLLTSPIMSIHLDINGKYASSAKTISDERKWKVSMRFPKRAKEEDDRPAYKRIKEHIENLIRSGRLKVGDAIPPESALTEQFKVSRMTANRALRELTDEGVLVRVQGSGTFVAQQKYQSTLVVILGITEEIMSRGHVHRCEKILLKTIAGSEGETQGPSSRTRPYVRHVKHLAARPTACPLRGLRRIGRRRASDMGGRT